MTDIYYKIQNGEEKVKQESDIITLVDMTELTSRKDIATLIQELKALKPKVLGIDIIFEGFISDGDGDEQLAEACLDMDSVDMVWAYKLTDYDDSRQSYLRSVHSFFITPEEQNEGFVNVVQNPNKSVKKYAISLPYKDTIAYSLPARIAQITIDSLYANCETFHTIDYRPVVFPVVKHDELDDFRDLITDHVVLLGAIQEERDKYYTPIGQLSGLEILAYTINSITSKNPLRYASNWVIFLWALLSGYIINIVDFLFTRKIRKNNTVLMLFFTRSKLYNKFITFIVMALSTWVSFELYAKEKYFVDTVLALSTIILITEGRLLYIGLLSVLKKHTKWKWVNNSIYNTELE